MSNTITSSAELETLIKKSSRIFIACHSSPDADAMGALNAITILLKENYQKLFVYPYAETVSQLLAFLPGFENVNTRGMVRDIQTNTPDLIIFLDFNMWHMVSPYAAEQIRAIVEKEKIPVVVIDHHPSEIKNINTNIFINAEDSSTCQTLFRVFHDDLNQELSANVCDNLLAGIISDTDRFKYSHPSAEYSFRIMPYLLGKAHFDVETITSILTRFPKSVLKSMQVLIQNTTMDTNTGLVYSVIRDVDVQKHGLVKSDISTATKYFMSNILLNIEGGTWGFVLYPHLKEPDLYTVSLRSADSTKSVQKIAEKLGGGGHEKASAARIRAGNSEEALDIILYTVKII